MRDNLRGSHLIGTVRELAYKPILTPIEASYRELISGTPCNDSVLTDEVTQLAILIQDANERERKLQNAFIKEKLKCKISF